jgi:hypothetical protein
MSSNQIINQEYISSLRIECDELIKLCSILNHSPLFQKKINSTHTDNQSVVLVKAEHIVLQDFINLYHRCEKADPKNNNAKAKFTLAYYYECLKRGVVSDSGSIEEINSKIQTPSFENKIKEVSLSVSNNFNNIFISSILKEIHSDHAKEMNHCIFKYVNFIVRSDNKVNSQEEIFLNEILSFLNIDSFNKNEIKNDSLELALAELNQLIGLKEVKETVKNTINFLQIQKVREKEKLPKVINSLHSVFIGPPGTGKTSVARILARIYKHLGLLEKGHLVETDRAGLVAGYVGQTSLKTEEVIKNALGGVLFIDEAYSLASNNTAGNDYGKEVLEILLKRMEDYREKFIVIVAGYPDEMKTFIESNPGLKSRFNQYFSFKHYSPAELLEIFKFFCSKYAFKPDKDSEEKILDIFEMADKKKTDSYGNAREVRNLFEHSIRLQANRLINVKEINVNTLSEILEEDIPDVKETVEKITAYGFKE